MKIREINFHRKKVQGPNSFPSPSMECADESGAAAKSGKTCKYIFKSEISQAWKKKLSYYNFLLHRIPYVVHNNRTNKFILCSRTSRNEIKTDKINHCEREKQGKRMEKKSLL